MPQSTVQIIEAGPVPTSYARTTRDEGPILRVGVIQHAWHATQALEQRLGSKVHPVLVYASLHQAAARQAPTVSRRGYTAEAAEAPTEVQWQVQGTRVTSWEHLPAVLTGHPHRVLQWRDIMHHLGQLRQLR